MFAMRLGCPNITGLKSSAEVLKRFPVGGSSSGRKFAPAPEQAAHQAAICRNSAASTVCSATVFISEIS